MSYIKVKNPVQPIKTESKAPDRIEDTLVILDCVRKLDPYAAVMLEMQYVTGLRFSDVRTLTFNDFEDRFGPKSSFTVIQNKIFNSSMTRLNTANKRRSASGEPVLSEKAMEARAARKAKVEIIITPYMRDIVTYCDKYQGLNQYSDGVLLFASPHKRSRGAPYRTEYVNKLLKSPELTELLRKASPNLTNRNLGTHSFRRAFGTELLHKGANVKLIMELLGQSSLESTAKYLQNSQEQKTHFLEQIGH
ncbi:site-specific integrase (plasmid) [Vibrio sp. SS-MA-C1-2]|uniref:tyrosine-type recombinase/integrase n=1 Tax=Vibrio sp. SS-MA-C1-2 TaxID=2908646 RepID=UPI001F3C2D6D|nr:site-specific integrase [Vibrio sp. SS-MA-C1-2]UJF20326.1 site-specific integrase [Vibrio sp. SS-MA-C1-2]